MAEPSVLPSGTQVIEVTGAAADITALVANSLLEIGAAASVAEHRFVVQVTSLSATNARVRLDSPLLMPYANNVNVQRLTLPAPAATAHLDPSARAGDSLLFVDNRQAQFTTTNDLIVIDQLNNAEREVRRIGALHLVTLSSPGAEAYPAGPLAEGVNLTDDSHITVTAALTAGSSAIAASDVSTLRARQTLLVGPVGTLETVQIQSIAPGVAPAGTITTVAPLVSGKAVGDLIIQVRNLTAAVPAGATFVALDNRMGLQQGDALRIGANPDDEYVTILALPNRAAVGPDPGNVLLAQSLTRDHQTSTAVVRQNPVTTTAVQPSVLALDALPGAPLLVSDGTGYAAGTFLRLTTVTDVFYHRVAALAAVPPGPSAQAPHTLTLAHELHGNHPVGSPVVEREALIDVQALDVGAWGNRLRVSVGDENDDPGLAQTRLTQFGPPTRLRLASLVGVEIGTILQLVDPITATPVGPSLKVDTLNPSTGDVTVSFPLNLAQQNAIAALPPGRQMNVRSIEFRLTVYLLRQPDPALPSRNDNILDSETFRNLSMDPRHSRYIHRVIGTTWTPGNPNDDDGRPLRLEDRRSEGESLYIRVRDRGTAAQLQTVRPGPEALDDALPSGRTRPARHPLEGGDDSITTLADARYRGADNVNPENRTGLESLRNVEEISIIACPGQTGMEVQNALITHCEAMRYRFAVLDGQPPPRDALADIQNQRQQFDTRFAALYHPWLLIRHPFPTNLATVPTYPIPPSGHMLGIYARTDIERGVHKAPANEVVRGILGLQRVLNKEQQDILNPYPVNINVIRDFRSHNRGIRVYGGRVITSDSDWKYVNVRRLLIFIEQSLDRGLQWVVFEPNAEPLWARVRRTISNFLTLVWRNGGLEGTKPEEAYFVKCDETTMTQTDIDSGRLICIVGVAPVKPAEFVIIRIGLWTARADD